MIKSNSKYISSEISSYNRQPFKLISQQCSLYYIHSLMFIYHICLKLYVLCKSVIQIYLENNVRFTVDGREIWRKKILELFFFYNSRYLHTRINCRSRKNYLKRFLFGILFNKMRNVPSNLSIQILYKALYSDDGRSAYKLIVVVGVQSTMILGTSMFLKI